MDSGDSTLVEHSIHVPVIFKTILRCLEDSVPVSWDLSRNYDGKFSLRVMEVRAKSHGLRHASSGSSVLKSDKVKTSTSTGIPDISDIKAGVSATGGSRKRKKKSPSQLKRDRRRHAAWRLKQQLSRENRQAEQAAARAPDADRDCTSPEAPKNKEPLEQADEQHCQDTSGAEDQHSEADSNHSDLSFGSESTTSQKDDLDTDKAVTDFLDFAHPALKRCANCEPTGPDINLRACSKCKSVKYCSVKCQREQWQIHKPVCATLVNLLQK